MDDPRVLNTLMLACIHACLSMPHHHPVRCPAIMRVEALHLLEVNESMTRNSPACPCSLTPLPPSPPLPQARMRTVWLFVPRNGSAPRTVSVRVRQVESAFGFGAAVGAEILKSPELQEVGKGAPSSHCHLILISS